MLVSSLLLTLESNNVLPLMSWELFMKLIFNTKPLWLDPSAPGDTGSYWYDPISGFSIDLRCLGTTRYVYLPGIHYTMIQYINWYIYIWSYMNISHMFYLCIHTTCTIHWYARLPMSKVCTTTPIWHTEWRRLLRISSKISGPLFAEGGDMKPLEVNQLMASNLLN